MKPSLVVLVVVVVAVAIQIQGAWGHVELKEGKLFVDGNAFFARGVGYEPVPIGVDVTTTPPYGDYFTLNYAHFYQRDLAILRPLGVNVLRLWGWGDGADHSDFLDAAYNKGVNPIYVAVEFWLGPSSYQNLADPTVIQRVLADFQLFLKTAKSHPAILFYILGSDLNASWNYLGQLDALFSLLNQLASAAHAFNSSSLVTTALNDINSLSTISTYDSSTKLDFWSLNLYRGCTFGTLWTQYPSWTTKGLFISEYGIDSYNDVAFAEDDMMQSNCIVQLTKEIALHNSTAMGGSIVEYVDEYWKGKLGIYDGRHIACPDYNPNHHSNCGAPNSAFPDGYVNQAWFGIVNASFVPRGVYGALKTLWEEK